MNYVKPDLHFFLSALALCIEKGFHEDISKESRFNSEFEVWCKTLSAKPLRVVKLIRAVEFWIIIVIKMESTIAHKREKPFWTPAKTQRVMVPGPINAAVIIIAGLALNLENIIFMVS